MFIVNQYSCQRLHLGRRSLLLEFFQIHTLQRLFIKYFPIDRSHILAIRYLHTTPVTPTHAFVQGIFIS